LFAELRKVMKWANFYPILWVTGGLALKSGIHDLRHDLRVDTLKTQLDVCQIVCASLDKELQASHLTLEEQAALAHRWDNALKESRSLRLAIDMMEGQETERA
jgi:hypothetical protein